MKEIRITRSKNPPTVFKEDRFRNVLFISKILAYVDIYNGEWYLSNQRFTLNSLKTKVNELAVCRDYCNNILNAVVTVFKRNYILGHPILYAFKLTLLKTIN